MNLHERIELLRKMGAHICDECAELLGEEWEEGDEGLKFCLRYKGVYGCEQRYYIFGHHEWNGPKFSWIVED